MDVSDRGQAHTVEAFSAAIVLLASIVFALQVTAVTPLTASTASQHIENQQSGVGNGILDEGVKSGALKRTLLYWNATGNEFHDAPEERFYYTSGGPPTEFGETLDETFLDRGVAFNLVVVYGTPANPRVQPISRLGTPSDNAVTVTKMVTLHDDDPIYDADESVNGTHTVSSSSLFENDQSPGSPVFDVVKVRLTIWRM